MNINKEDFKDSLNFIWIAILFFLCTINIIFPFVMIIMKIVFYIIGIFMFTLGLGTMARSVFSKKNKIETLKEQDIK